MTGPLPGTPATSANAAPPLAGIRVVDLSRVLAGPYTTMLLGDLGAEVIKVERPGSGDDTRTWGPPFAGEPGHQESTYFLSANRNKRSVALDLKDAAGRAALSKLIADADVLVENFRPGVLDRLGFGEQTLAQLNPRLVSVSITGFGDSGPERGRVGYDQILQAEAGLMSLTGASRQQPTRVGVPIADLTAGLFAVIGVLAALIERNRSDMGQHVHTSLLAGQIAIHVFQGTRYLVAGEVPHPSGNHHPTVAPYGLFHTADVPIMIAVGNDDIWVRFASVAGIDPGDLRFRDNAHRVANRRVLEDLIESRFSEHGADHWLAALAQQAVPAGEVRTLDRVYTSEQVRQQGLILEVEHPTLGRLELPGNPLRFSRSGLAAPSPPPLLDQHGEELRARLAAAGDAPPRPSRD